jgi:hypothetical protein
MIPPIFKSILDSHTSIYLGICSIFFSLLALKTQNLPSRKFTMPPQITPAAEDEIYDSPTSEVKI